MRFSTPLTSRASLAGLAGLALMGLAACAGDSNPARDLVASVGAGPKMATTPDFVSTTRPATLEYMPVGTSNPGRTTAAKTADELKAVEAELDAARTRNEAAGAAAAQLGGTPAPEPVVLPKKPGSVRTQ
ncbi:hypothetical protein [Microvirga alba]|uniref:DUF3035 domain-containing protein n=1 Tax=Microvirga alba TaxID=2791025 RepID=A0A931FPD9_9HYPH|nr:hypothetical protein [Microvirga alba]MBF9234650.1 hypothetical protein [Microvirga alba]